MTGTTSIYNASSTGFRVYVRYIDHPTEAQTVGNGWPNPLTTSTARSVGLKVRWTAISTGSSSCGSGTQALTRDNDNSEGLKLSRDLRSDSRFMIVPNPGHNTISVVSDEELTSYEVFSLNGQLLSSHVNIPIDISGLKRGTYILRAKRTTDSATISELFIKQ